MFILWHWPIFCLFTGNCLPDSALGWKRGKCCSRDESVGSTEWGSRACRWNSGISCKHSGQGFPGGPVAKDLPANARDVGLIPGLGTSHWPRDNEALLPTTAAHLPRDRAAWQREATAVRRLGPTAGTQPPLTATGEERRRSSEDQEQPEVINQLKAQWSGKKSRERSVSYKLIFILRGLKGGFALSCLISQHLLLGY